MGFSEPVSSSMIRTFFSVWLLLFCSIVLAQNKVVGHFFKDVDPSSLSSATKNTIQACKYRIISIDIAQLYAELEHIVHCDGLNGGSPLEIELPQPDGTKLTDKLDLVLTYQFMQFGSLTKTQ